MDTPRSALGFSDRELEARVEDNLVANHIPGVSRLAIEARRGTVTLRGRLGSYHQRQRCVHLSRGVAGVVELVDRIDVVAAAPSQGMHVHAFRESVS